MAKANVQKASGFTLVELAIVVVLIGVLMTLGLKTLTATLDNATFSETKAKQERIKTALVSYLRTNGVLPCPDNSGDATVATGSAPATCKTAASDGYGVVPWQTLGISRETVIDGWGNYFTYRVANGFGGLKNWTEKASAANDFTVNELKIQTDALTVQELSADGSALVDLTKKAVVVILSHGKNGFGAKTTKVGTRMPTDDAGDGEKTNATTGTTTFVRRPVADAAPFNGAYDDFVAYMAPQDLLQPLISEGTVKACAAYCDASISSVCSNSAQTCTCVGSGPNLPGLPGSSNPCSGGASCSTCTAQPIMAGCSPAPLPAAQIPIGAIPATCL